MFTVLVSNAGGHDGTTRFNLWLIEDFRPVNLTQHYEEATQFPDMKAAQAAIDKVKKAPKAMMPYWRTRLDIYKDWSYITQAEGSLGHTLIEAW